MTATIVSFMGQGGITPPAGCLAYGKIKKRRRRKLAFSPGVFFVFALPMEDFDYYLSPHVSCGKAYALCICGFAKQSPEDGIRWYRVQGPGQPLPRYS